MEEYHIIPSPLAMPTWQAQHPLDGFGDDASTVTKVEPKSQRKLLPPSFIQSMTYEAGILEYEDFPRTHEPVWILGKQYSALYDLEEIKRDIRSRLWLTYRKGFTPIGGNGPMTDSGWGCMLRCGQMMLAQALVLRHLSREWRWSTDKYDPKYHEILRMFQDRKASCYSIHQIASMGVSEGKSIGHWFGPNTVAQVIRKLSVYDEWSSLAIHVAMDNTIIIDDIEMLCKYVCRGCQEEDGKLSPVPKSSRKHRLKSPAHRASGSPRSASPRSSSPAGSIHSSSSSSSSSLSHINGHHPETSSPTSGGPNTRHRSKRRACSQHWKPLLLIIPLRLGLSEINPVYVPCLKACLTMKQSVGIIGGKPNHAHWFIGFVEDELVYLDPHVVQPVVDLTQSGQSDESFHCQYSCRLNIHQLDPSIGLGFYIGSIDDFEDWLINIRKLILHGQKTAMFEIHQHRPAHWPPFKPYTQSPSTSSSTCSSDERLFDTDEEFELL